MSYQLTSHQQDSFEVADAEVGEYLLIVLRWTTFHQVMRDPTGQSLALNVSFTHTAQCE